MTIFPSPQAVTVLTALDRIHGVRRAATPYEWLARVATAAASDNGPSSKDTVSAIATWRDS